MPVYIEKSGDLVGCHHSGTTTTTEKGKIGLLSQWTMDGGDEQLSKRSFLVEESPPPIKCSIRGQQKMTRRSSRRPRCCCLRAYADVEIPPDCQIQRSTISGEIIFFFNLFPHPETLWDKSQCDIYFCASRASVAFILLHTGTLRWAQMRRLKAQMWWFKRNHGDFIAEKYAD